MNKRIAMKVLKRYFSFFGVNKGETKEQLIRRTMEWKERYMKSFINWVYKKYGEGDITKDRYLMKCKGK